MKKPIRLLLLAASALLVSGSLGSTLNEATIQGFAEESAVSRDFVHATPLNAYTRSSYSGTYYSGIDLNGSGDSLLQSLRSLTISSYEGSSYDGLKSGLPKICRPADGSNYMVGFYNRAHLTTSWDGASTWNREHTWPNSRGAGTSGAGSNPFVIMPTSVSVNSSRGNSFYGEGGSNTWDPGQYDEQFRGAAARCILYAAMHYEGLTLSENPGDSSSKNTMGVKSLLLEWNRTYAPDDDESYRNELTAEEYGIRNPFIDYPYLADNIWGEGGGTVSSSIAASSASYSTSSSTAPASEYSLVTSRLQEGDKIVINNVKDGAGYALSKYSVNDARPWYKAAEASSVSSNKMDPTSSTAVFTVGVSGSGYTLTEEDQGKLLAYTSGTHKSISYESDTFESDETNDVWNISIASDGTANLSSTVGSSTIYLNYQLYTTSYNSTPEYVGSDSSYDLYLFREESGGEISSSSSSSSSSESESGSSTSSTGQEPIQGSSSEDSASEVASSEVTQSPSEPSSISSSEGSNSGSSSGGGCSSSIAGGFVALGIGAVGLVTVIIVKKSKKKGE